MGASKEQAIFRRETSAGFEAATNKGEKNIHGLQTWN